MDIVLIKLFIRNEELLLKLEQINTIVEITNLDLTSIEIDIVLELMYNFYMIQKIRNLFN